MSSFYFGNVDSLEWIPLYEDPLMAILPKDMDMHGKKAFPITEMANQPFVISAEGVDYDIHQVLKETGIEPDIRFSSMDDHVVISIVANNLGISMLPNLVIGNARAQIQALPLEPNFFQRTWYRYPFLCRSLSCCTAVHRCYSGTYKYFLNSSIS